MAGLAVMVKSLHCNLGITDSNHGNNLFTCKDSTEYIWPSLDPSTVESRALGLPSIFLKFSPSILF